MVLSERNLLYGYFGSQSLCKLTIFCDNGRVTSLSQAQTVADRFQARIEELETRSLSELATKSYPAQRQRPEQECRLRTPFQRDRDRILHSKAFRRLKHKTQVFILPEGDHFRTRLTHTLEVAQVSRTVARALRLNEDLVEAISLGHDLGHTPFGHIGEESLDRCVAERFGGHFRHYEHSLRIVDHLERDGHGLNLCDPVRDGILNHSGDARPATLEGKIVKLVDRIVYINHDIDDAMRGEVLVSSDLPKDEIAVLGNSSSARIDTLVHDLVEHSERSQDIAQGPEVGPAMSSLREFMFREVYLSDRARRENVKIDRVIRGLFEWYVEHPQELPARGAEMPLGQRVIDYIAGMTDRYAARAWNACSMPAAFAIRD